MYYDVTMGGEPGKIWFDEGEGRVPQIDRSADQLVNTTPPSSFHSNVMASYSHFIQT